MVAFLDRLVNLVTGMGGPKDKTTATAYGLTLITRQELEAAYRSDWLARKIVDIVPFDMTREWRDWQAEEKQIEGLEAAERTLRVRDKVAAALQRSRLYGGAAIYVSIASQNPEMPLNIETVKAGTIDFLHVVNCHDLSAGQIERDPLSPFFGEPRYYEMSGGQGAQVRIHPSRMVRFIGAALPDPFNAPTIWGDPVLQIVYDAIQQAASISQNVAHLVHEAKVDVIRVPGLSDALSTTEGTNRLTSRFALMQQMKANQGLVLMEGSGKEDGETWSQKKVDFGQLPELMRLFLQVAAGAADIPVTRLLGQSPAGLNATGDADIRNYYDHLAARQEVELRPALDRLDELLIRHALGVRPPEVHYTFAPLWQLSEKERAEVGKLRAETWNILATSAVVPSPVLEQAVRNALIEGGEMPGIEQAYADLDAGTLVEEEPEEIEDPQGQGIRQPVEA